MSLHLDDDYDEPSPRHSELTLSTGVLLGGLFGLVLLCGLCFWLGYSMRGPRAAALPPTPTVEADSSAETFSSFKPAAGSPVSAGATTPSTPPSTPAPSQPHTIVATPQPVPVAPRPAQTSATPVPESVPTQSSSGFYVQVAAVSHQQDADKLTGTLRAEGYLVTSRTAPQDTLFHVQIGPYATHKDADLVRQKLIGEGYTPFVK